MFLTTLTGGGGADGMGAMLVGGVRRVVRGTLGRVPIGVGFVGG